jgi:hypothetical protein
MQTLKEDIQNAREYLLKVLKPGSVVYGQVTQVSRTGMNRHIKLFTVVDNELVNITWYASLVMEGKYAGDNKYGERVLKVPGCGMDMVFHTIYGLSSSLFRGNFFCIGKGCPANDHSNDREPDYSPHRLHSDAGYALRYKHM